MDDVKEMTRRFALASEFTLDGGFKIVQRGHQKWAILDDCGNVLTKDGEWEYEPMPSGRSSEFIERTRFTLDDAFARLPHLTA